ncbi:MAG: PstS family phosphate ABC transporter substrate-binding protein [Nitrospira sp.]|nr:PstS family phosphate ABC transporter substrate-binding protein [Nitrospira sp.]
MSAVLFRGAGVIALLVAMGVTGLSDTVGAQLKPTTDPHIHAYVRSSSTITGSLTVVGSDTMKPLTKHWERKLKEFYPHVDIRIQGSGSEQGPPALLEKTAQIIAVSRPLTPAEILEFKKQHGYEPTEVPVATDALAIFVHRDNPITGLTFKELEAMFCKERRRQAEHPIIKWGQLGLEGEWREADIWLHGRTSNSGTASFFREKVCLNGEFSPKVIDEPGSASIVVEIMKDRYAIGYSGIGYRTSTVRPVPLAERASDPFVEATFDNAINGTYPLRRLLYLYVDKSPEKELAPIVAEFVKFATSHEGQEIVVKEGFFPLPTDVLNRLSALWSHSMQAAGLFPNSMDEKARP